MQTHVLTPATERSWAVILETDDEVLESLTRFAREYDLDASRFTAIGAFAAATLGYFDLERRDYDRVHLAEQVEVLSLIGDIAIDADTGKVKVHAHTVLGKRDGSAHGGHLLAATVRPTLEVMLSESPAHLRRRFDPRYGLALISTEGAPCADTILRS